MLHPGSCLKTDETECLNRIASNLDYIFEQVPDHTKILLETMAGQGSSICYTLNKLHISLKNLNIKNVLASALIHAMLLRAGYDFRTADLYDKLWHNFDSIIGINKLKVIHINDSKKELGSRVDRHEDIGKGQLG